MIFKTVYHLISAPFDRLMVIGITVTPIIPGPPFISDLPFILILSNDLTINQNTY